MNSIFTFFTQIFILSLVLLEKPCLAQNSSSSVTYLQLPEYERDGRVKYSPRIVGGKKAREGELRGIVSIQTWNSEHVCGATWFQLGNISQILTAAHCIMDKNKQKYPRFLLQVMGDDLSTSTTSTNGKRQVRKVRRIIAHPKYDPNTLVNDIAVILLTSPFKATNTFAPVPLTNKSIADYQPCTVAGWGYLEYEKPPQSIDLMITNVSVVPWEICNGPHAYKGLVGKHAFCAGSMEGGADSCQGDSGGPITSNNTLVGVVSFGKGCGFKNYPGVYTNVDHYTHWIRQVASSSPKNIQSYILLLATTAAYILYDRYFYGL